MTNEKSDTPLTDAATALASQALLIELKCGKETGWIVQEAIKALRAAESAQAPVDWSQSTLERLGGMVANATPSAKAPVAGEVADVIANLKDWEKRSDDLLIQHARRTIESLSAQVEQEKQRADRLQAERDEARHDVAALEIWRSRALEAEAELSALTVEQDALFDELYRLERDDRELPAGIARWWKRATERRAAARTK